jgi:UDP:flavonoid glycosyltransferase YjiC (YdhE family)
MPYCWDGHDNATRVQETGHGLKLHRYDWTPDQLGAAIRTLLGDAAMKAKLARTCAHMRSADGRRKAATLFDRLLQGKA